MNDTSWRTEEWLEAQIAYIKEARDNGRYDYNEADWNLEKYYAELWKLRNPDDD